METILAPWPKELVDKMNVYQHNPFVHPYTCGNCRDTLGTRFIKDDGGSLIREPNREYKYDENHQLIKGPDWKEVIVLERELIATENGWICPTCDYTQDWCINPDLM